MTEKTRHYTPKFIKDCLTNGGESAGLVTCSGTVVDLVNNADRPPLVLRLDDGTGTVQAVIFRPPPSESKTAALKIGDNCVVSGMVQTYRETLQIKCDRIKRVTDPNHYTMWINQVIYYKSLQK